MKLSKKIERKNYLKNLNQEIDYWKSKLENNELLLSLFDNISKEQIDKDIEEYYKYHTSNKTMSDGKILSFYIHKDHFFYLGIIKERDSIHLLS